MSDLLAVSTSTGEAISEVVIAAFFALLAWACVRRGRRSVGIFYSVFAACAVVLAAIAAGGHVFHGL